MGGFQFPTGSASAARVLGIGKALREAGNECSFFGLGGARPQDECEGNSYQYQGFRYAPRWSHGTAWNRPRKLTDQLLTGYSLERRLHEAGFRADDAVILYQWSSAAILRMEWLCRKVGAGLILDTVEWYDPGHITGGRLGPFSLDSVISQRFLAPRIRHHIAISSFLERHFKEAGCEVARVPPLIDPSEDGIPFAPTPRGGTGLKLVYAGSPGKKDLLQAVLTGIVKARERGIPVEITILGPSLSELLPYLPPGVSAESEPWLQLAGRVEQEEIPRLLARHDYSVLLRPPKRYAQAGFPTKVVESLAAGVPVICNHTSDLASHIREGETGWVCQDESVESFAHALERAAAASLDDQGRMRRAAREEALRAFSYLNYTAELSQLVESAVASRAANRAE